MAPLSQCLCDNREASFDHQVWVLLIAGRFIAVRAVRKALQRYFVGRLVAGQWFPREA